MSIAIVVASTPMSATPAATKSIATTAHKRNNKSSKIRMHTAIIGCTTNGQMHGPVHIYKHIYRNVRSAIVVVTIKYTVKI